MTTPTTVNELLDYWSGNIPCNGSLVSGDGCMSAQGQALHFLGGFTADQLRELDQRDADRRVAELFGISTTQSVLLRIVNDDEPGAPSCVIRNPEQVLGDQAQAVLAFWRHLDRMDSADWAAARAAMAAAGAVAREAAWTESWAVARVVARVAVGAVAWAAAMEAAGEAAGATNEIQGAAVMRAKGQPFFFLPLFGFADPETVITAALSPQA